MRTDGLAKERASHKPWERRVTMRSYKVFGTLVGLLLVSTVFAQNDPNLEQGLKPYGSYHGGDLDSISLTSGNLTVQIPLISYPQRGNLRFGFELAYNAKPWIIKVIGTHPDGNPIEQWQYRGFGVQPVRTPSYVISRQIFKDPLGNTQFIEYTATTPDGGGHPLGQTSASGSTQVYESVDATGLRYSQGGSTAGITDGSGVTYNVG